MLLKHKKCYQETNEDVIDPPDICQYIAEVGLIYTGDIDIDPVIFDAEWVVCNDMGNTIITESVAATDEEIVVNTCVKQGTFTFDGMTFFTSGSFSTTYWQVDITFTVCP